MATQFERLADSLALLAKRLRLEAAQDDGALREKFGGAMSELLLLRAEISRRVALNDSRLAELKPLEAVLADIAMVFDALPHAKTATAVSRPVARRNRKRAAELDASTRRLLKRAAIVIGVSGASAFALSSPGWALAGCTGSTSVTCSGLFTDGISFTDTVTNLLVQSLTGNITPPSGTSGILLQNNGSEGTHHGSGGTGERGGDSADLVLNSLDTSYTITTQGNYAYGVAAFSFGGGAGNGGGGAPCPIPCISGGNAGAGGNGGNVTLNNYTSIFTNGDNAVGVYAISHGGQGGDGGDSNGGPSSGSGGAGGDAGTVRVTNDGAITTQGYQAHGIYAAAIGGNGGGGGSGVLWSSGGHGGIANVGGDVFITNDADGAIHTTGINAMGIYGESIGGFGGGGGNSAGIFGYGGGGSLGGDAKSVTITNYGQVITEQQDSYAIFAQSVGGGGGNGGGGAGIVGLGAGGDIGGKGAAVSVENHGQLTTYGQSARGIFAQSIGGGGGNGGSGAGLGGIGGSGSGTSPGGTVLVTNSGEIATYGDDHAYAIEAQSIGGGGGDGGSSIGLVSVGGTGGSGGDSDIVTVHNTGLLYTQGYDSSAIFAQSVGGGGGNGGNAVAVGAQLAFSLGGGGGPGGDGKAVTVTSDTGTITTVGDRSNGIQVQSVGGGGGSGGFAVSASAGLYFSLSVAIGGRGGHGGDAYTVDLTNGSDIITYGQDSHGIFAQSVGGGGGSGGVSVALAGSNGVSGTFAMGGHGADGGNSNIVTVGNSGDITTYNYHSYGILAQSVGGGGGDGGLSISGAAGMNGALGVGVGGDGGGGGIGNKVILTNTGDIYTAGDESIGILAQSVGGGGGNGGGTIAGSISQSASFSVGVGGNAGEGEDADTSYLETTGDVTTFGQDAHAIVSQSIGGGGGNGGFSVAAGLSQGFAGTAAVGGKGGFAGDAFDATLIAHAGTVTTVGDHAFGLLAQSIGGGGGDGGFAASGGVGGDGSVNLGIGGSGDGGGAGGTVHLTSDADITTWGLGSFGILAQSIGGGGGDGGLSITAGGSKTANLGISIGGSGKGGGNADEVHATSNGLVTTHGEQAIAILAQSVGGGGGNGGDSLAFGASQEASINFALGGSGDGGGNGVYVELHNNGGAITWGDLSDAVVAQSIGGGGGNGGFAVTGTLSEGYAGSIAIGGTGDGGGDGGDVFLTGDGYVQTDGFKSFGIVAQSIGGGGGNGGFSVAGTISKDAAGTFSIGGNGGTGGDAHHVTLTTGSNVVTGGVDSIGVIAQSVGGGGGNGGFAVAGQVGGGDTVSGISVAVGGKGDSGGNGGLVDLTSTGDIVTIGDGSHGVVAQSIGGGGGNGGFGGSYVLSLGDGASANFGVGGNGAGGGDGDIVHATVSGAITTYGDGAYGLLAQSVGGGGGDGGWGMAITFATGEESKGSLVGAIGGTGGGGGLAKLVDVVNSAWISTSGSHSYGILAQSLGGGGGNGGFAASGVLSNGTDSKVVAITVGGAGGDGNDAGEVLVTNSGEIVTTGDAYDPTGNNIGKDAGQNKTGSIGILAQSIGGGGGNGGAAYSGVISGPDTKTLAVGVGGLGGDGGIGNIVTVTNNLGGNIETDGSFAYGIEAQSIGGGGGNGGMALSAVLSKGGEGTNLNANVTVGGGGGDGSYAQLVDLTNFASIITHGVESTGLIAQSIGGGGGNGGAAITAILGISDADPANTESRTVNVAAAIGGKGGTGSNGGQVIVENHGGIITFGDQSEGINAQSIGGGGGTGGNANTMSFIVAAQCTLPGVCGSPDSSARNYNFTATVGGDGGGASDGDTVTVTNYGAITTHGEESDGIFAQSIGGGGGAGGNGTIGSGGLVPFVPLEFVFLPVSNVKLWQSIQIAVGGNAGSTGVGKLVTVENHGGITTLGDNSIAIAAQSVGGGGGMGGTAGQGLFGLVGIGGKGGAGGNGGEVIVTNTAELQTVGDAAEGIFAQSVGGGGGVAGNVKRGLSQILGTKNAVGLGFAFGQGGGDGGDGDDVTVTNTGDITTQGAGSHGIFAQSVGGGGGVLGDLGNDFGSGLQLLDFFVGSVGDKGDGKDVTVTENGTITTYGSGAAGVFAQSAGGQGVGNLVQVTLNGDVVTHGARSIGILAQSVGLNGGGEVKLLGHGNIVTSGDDSIGALIESFGAASLENDQVVQTVTTGLLIPFATGVATAGNITVNRTGGTIDTTGADSHGLVAHSISSQGDAGTVDVTYKGSIFAHGTDADAIVVQSTGLAVTNDKNLTVTLNGGGTVSGGTGTGAAVRFIDGADNLLTNHATLITEKDLAGVTVVGGIGNEDLENYGTFGGELALGGGTNTFYNHVPGTILAGALLDMGGPSNFMDNDGALSPGHIQSIFTSEIDGSYRQHATGNLKMDVDFGALTADRLNVTGTADLNGKLTLDYINIQAIRPGTTDMTLIDATSGATDSGLTLSHQQSIIVNYNLAFATANDVDLTTTVDFAPQGSPINANDTSIGNYINAVQTAGSDPSLAPLINAVFDIPTTQGLHDFYTHLSSEPFLTGQFTTVAGATEFADSMLSCHPYSVGDNFRFMDEATCTWARISPKSVTLEHTAANLGSNTDEVEMTLGRQQALGDHFRVGIAGAYTQTSNHVETLSSTHGKRLTGGLSFKALFDPVEFAAVISGGEANLATNRVASFGAVAHSKQNNSYTNERLRAAWQAWNNEDSYIRPFADLNFTQLHTGAFTETGAGALDLVVDSAKRDSINASLGLEIGSEFNLDGHIVMRPFASYQLVGVLQGDVQEISAGFEGAPAGVTPFTITNATDKTVNQVNVGFDLIGAGGVSVRASFSGAYGNKTKQELYALKVAVPF